MGTTTRLQRAIAALREEGWHVEKVEYPLRIFSRRESGRTAAWIRRDMLGIIDLLCLRPGRMLGVQVCGSDMASHRKKIADSENTERWLGAGGELEIHSWRRIKQKRGGKRLVWDRRVEVVEL